MKKHLNIIAFASIIILLNVLFSFTDFQVDLTADGKHSISKETVFIRELYSHFWQPIFGSPLYNTFATFCNVVFDYENSDPSALTAAKVRKALN